MSGIVFGCITPHPPLIVPDVGRGQESAVKATIAAMEQLSLRLAESHPEAVLIISPHGTGHADQMGIFAGSASEGDMQSWGSRTPGLRFENDKDLVQAIIAECQETDVPVESIGNETYELDHGVMVPMHFLSRAIRGLPLVPVTFSWLPLQAHFAFGQAIRSAAIRLNKKLAIIASGDLSHRLIPGTPAGYDIRGKTFDDKLVHAISRMDEQAVLNLDPRLIERAGECGLRSIVILLGAMHGSLTRPQVLSYEGPFGVGYMVASITVENHHPLVELARTTVESFIRTGDIPAPKKMTPEMLEQAGVFVCLKEHGYLRGCIGTFEPTRANVAEEVVANAVSSATRDPRFPPVSADELPGMEYTVDVLTSPKPVKTHEELDPRKYGVIVECGRRKGLLLPDLEGVDSVEQQIDICRQKAGILPSEPIKLYRFEVKRYK